MLTSLAAVGNNGTTGFFRTSAEYVIPSQVLLEYRHECCQWLGPGYFATDGKAACGANVPVVTVGTDLLSLDAEIASLP